MTNLQILNSGIEKIALEGAKPPETIDSKETKEVKLIEKPKRGRGAPKKALINTEKLLTGAHGL